MNSDNANLPDYAAANIAALPSVQSVQIGAIAPLGPSGVPSGIVKHSIAGRVAVGFLNFAGDAQADLRIHGGADKAVYAYAASRYREWIADFPQHREQMTAGIFGENLTISGMDELDLCAGDVHAVGSARLQVCQPRQPCFKLALRLGDNRLPKAMVRTRRSGWYYRVLQEGDIGSGDTVRLIDRPNPNLSFSTLIALVYNAEVRTADIELVAEADGVAQWLRSAARKALIG